MIPVPPPLRLEFGTGRSAVPLKVTEVMLASVVVVSSMATPTTRMRSAPLPMACVQDSDVRPVEVVAARLAASKEIAAAANGAAARISPTTSVAVRPAFDWSLYIVSPLAALENVQVVIPLVTKILNWYAISTQVFCALFVHTPARYLSFTKVAIPIMRRHNYWKHHTSWRPLIAGCASLDVPAHFDAVETPTRAVNSCDWSANLM